MMFVPLPASQLPPWVPLAVQGILASVSAVFAAAAYLLKKKIEDRDTQQHEMQQQLQELLKVVPVLEALRADIDSEEAERKRIEEQQWSKINAALAQASELVTTISRTQTACRDLFVTQTEWSRAEKLRGRQDDMLGAQIHRLESQLDSLLGMLQIHLRTNGRK